VLPLQPDDLPDAVREWLPGDVAFDVPQQGQCSALAFVVGAPIVVKRMRGALYSSAAEWEYKALIELAGTDLPIPEALGLHVREHEGEREAWLCMSRLPGEPLPAVLERSPDVDSVCRWYAALGDLAARIHATPIPNGLRPDGPLTWFERILRRTRRATERVRGLLMRLARERLPDTPETLIHGDFTLDNVLADGDRISGVIDWGGAGPGDPRYDLTLALSTSTPGASGEADVPLEPRAVTAFLEGYCAAPIPRELRRFVEQTYQMRRDRTAV
jgi:aminoglycoside phosphotransferase (APT) family kinase protein